MTVWTVPARVVRVVDGDTLIMDLDLGWKVWRLGERCRLAGVNAPELGTPEGEAAQEWVTQRLGMRPAAGAWLKPMVIFTSTGLDKYGRPLGVVRLEDGTLLADALLDAGHAVRA